MKNEDHFGRPLITGDYFIRAVREGDCGEPRAGKIIEHNPRLMARAWNGGKVYVGPSITRPDRLVKVTSDCLPKEIVEALS
jgi:hypothetical protein